MVEQCCEVWDDEFEFYFYLTVEFYCCGIVVVKTMGSQSTYV